VGDELGIGARGGGIGDDDGIVSGEASAEVPRIVGDASRSSVLPHEGQKRLVADTGAAQAGQFMTCAVVYHSAAWG